MGSAHYIVLEKDIEGLDVEMDGKKLSRNIEALDDLAEKLGVRPLSEFYSVDPEAAEELLESEGGEADDQDFPPLQQFSARDGLATVRALLAQPEARPAIEDLQNCERILSVAEEQGVGWHFEIDV
jgi:hypothetical protein